LERRRRHEAWESEQFTQTTACLHQEISFIRSEQESKTFLQAKDGLITALVATAGGEITHTIPR